MSTNNYKITPFIFYFLFKYYFNPTNIVFFSFSPVKIIFVIHNVQTV